MKHFYLLLLLSFTCVTNAQILNIEQQRIVTDTTGWAGKLAVNVAATKTTKSLFAFTGLGHIQFKTNKSLFLLISNYNIVNGDGENFDNNGYAHFRYNYKVNNLLRWEAYTQIQFNSLTKIRQRWLTGSGPRFKLSELEKAKFYFGLAYMFELEQLNDPNIINRDHRFSSYFTFTLLPEEKIRLINTTYIQPLIRNFNDYRLSNDTNLQFRISSRLSFNTRFSFLWDARPPADVPSQNYSINNGIIYKFQ